MYMYDYFLKDGTRKVFFCDEPFIPNEVEVFFSKHKEDIESSFADHFPITVKEFMGNKELKEYEVICK